MPEPPESWSLSLVFRFTEKLPLVVFLGQERWVIFHQHFPKGKAAVVASNGNTRGFFAGGHERDVEAKLYRGISVPAGTRRFDILRELLKNGWVEIVDIAQYRRPAATAAPCERTAAG